MTSTLQNDFSLIEWFHRWQNDFSLRKLPEPHKITEWRTATTVLLYSVVKRLKILIMKQFNNANALREWETVKERERDTDRQTDRAEREMWLRSCLTFGRVPIDRPLRDAVHLAAGVTDEICRWDLFHVETADGVLLASTVRTQHKPTANIVLSFLLSR